MGARPQRARRRYGHAVPAACVLLTGRVGAGKRTIGAAVVADLRARGIPAIHLERSSVERYLVPEGDALTWLGTTLVDSGVLTLITAPVPRRDDREAMRARVPGFVEVYVDAPAELCAQRAGTTDDGYEEPYAPDLRVPTHDRGAAASTAQLLSYLEEQGIVEPDAR